MIKWYYLTLKEKYNKYHYFSRFNKKLRYSEFKKKNWNDQLKLSFKADRFYKSKFLFFKKYFKKDNVEYVNYIKKNINKKKKILSIGSGRGIAELKLLDLGYNIALSDINYPKGLGQLKLNFKNLKFIKFNIFKDKMKKKYDVIICFNLIYAFDKYTLNKFFKNCKKIINKNGIIIISPGSSTLNIYKIIYDRIYLPIEIYFLYFLSFFKKKKFEVFKFHHGYTYSSQDIINLAKKNNLILTKKIIRNDYVSEFDRSIIIKNLISRGNIMKKIFTFFGKKIPFVNFFYFEIRK